MITQDKIPEPTPETTASETTSRPAEAKRPVWLAATSIVLTVAAWIAGTFSGVVAMIISASAIIVGAMALKSRRHAVRNTAITSIIASAVLFVVIAAFLIVIYAGLKTV